jgi:alkylation response protein AidB-like acyl-CoA dehydrogenase
MTTPTVPHTRGGDWLVSDAAADLIFTPERLTDEHRLVAQTASAFVRDEVLPAIDALESKDWTRARALIRRSGDLGLLGTDVPEAFGGVGLDKAASTVVGEAVGAGASFATTFGGQTGLAITPILWFGTPAQRAKYLPRFVSGEIVGAYCLSESSSGSDALGARTRAVRQPDGSWLLTGEKMWTTNGGFADVFIVFAKVDGEKFTAFIVERTFPGVTTGGEEHKMGLLGSSTTSVILSDARVPADGLLGEVGQGHRIAFNVLNLGRFKLAAMCSGGAKLAIREAASYATTRKQFGQPISTFGAIRQKLAEMTIREYVVESMLYRTTGYIDAAIEGAPDDPTAAMRALEEFAVEASLLKIAGSEMLDFVLDENVQIHGGNGFVHDYPAERHYRDARVNRIFEGTNEINRLLAPGLLIKRALKGGPPVIDAAKRLRDEIQQPVIGSMASGDDDPMAATRQAVGSLKRTTLMVLGLALDTYRDALSNEQEILMLASDLMLLTYAAESALLRAAQITHAAERHSGSSEVAALQRDAAAVFAHDAGLQADGFARTAISAMTAGDTERTMLAALRRLLKVPPVNTIAARRRIADRVVNKKGYIFE